MQLQFVKATVCPEQSAHNLSDALRRHSLTLADVVRFAAETCNGKPVFAAGSATVGLANIYSDIDLLCVDSVPQAQSRVRATRLGTLRIDLETWAMRELSRVASLFEHALNLGGSYEIYRETTLHAAYRLVTGLSLVNADAIEVIRRPLSPEVFQIYMVRHRCGATDNALQDAIGALRSQDFDYAFLRARDAVAHAAEAALALAGDLNPMSKFLIKRLTTTFDTEHPLYRLFVEANSCWPNDRHVLTQRTETLVRAAKQVLALVEKHIWDSPLVTHTLETEGRWHPDPH